MRSSSSGGASAIPFTEQSRQAVGQAPTLYGLTAAEAQVIREIGKGGTLRDIGQRLHVSENTLKTHLQPVFDKTGVRRQSDLVSLVASLMPPVRSLPPTANESALPGS